MPFLLFLSMGATFGLFISLIAVVDWPSVRSQTRILEMAAWIIPGALANVAGHLAIARAMATGRQPVAWAIGQGGQALTFIATLLIWNESAGVASWAGLAAILAGVALLSRNKSSGFKPVSGNKWVYWSVAAMLFYGINQTLMSVPSHWEGWNDAARLRLPTTLLVVGLAGMSFSARPKKDVLVRLLPWVIPYGILVCVCFFTVYLSIDRLSVVGCAALAWPLACSTGVVAYAIGSHFTGKCRISIKESVGIATVVAGILALTSHF